LNSTYFGRKYRVIVGTEGGNGLNVSELRCVFEVDKTLATEPNSAFVEIFNLAPSTRDALFSDGSRLILEAGYRAGLYGLIFDGDVIKADRRNEDNVTTVLKITAQDGDTFHNMEFISKSYAAGQTHTSIIADMAGIGGTSLGKLSENMDETKLARGKVMFGAPKDYARAIAKSEGGLFYVNDRKINLIKPMDVPTGEAVLISPKTGLVGEVEQTDDGIKCKVLLNPSINIDTMVVVDRSSGYTRTGGKQLGDGVYKVLTVKHEGDTRGEPWYTHITAVAQPGAVPLTGPSYNK
jgi:hypothetical protein